MHDDAGPTDVKGRRVGAFVIDIVIGAAVGFLIVVVLLAAGVSEFSDGASDLLGLVIALVLFVFLPGTTGWTLGKLMLGLRVVHRDTYEVAGIGRNFLRWLLLIIDAFPYFPPIVGPVMFLVDKQGRRLGDRAARTLVIHHSYLGAKPAPAQADAPGQAPDYGQAADYGIPADPGDQADEQAAGDAAPADPGGQPSGEADQAGAVDPVREADPDEQSTGDQVAAAAGPGDAEPAGQPDDDDAPGSQAVEHAAEQADEQPGVGSPHWDTDRGAYIQQHPDTGEWLQWDDDAKIWGPISQA